MKLGIITDIHEDYISLRKALHFLEKECHEIVCLGDIVGFTTQYYHFKPDANECVRLIRKNCKYSVAGNHDMFAIKRLPVQSGKFKFSENWYSLSFSERRKIAGNRVWLYENEQPAGLSDSSIEFLTNLPESVVFEKSAFTVLLTHFLYPDISGSETLKICTHKDVDTHFRSMEAMNCNISFFGHTHTERLWMAQQRKSRFKLFQFPVSLIAFDKTIQLRTKHFFSIPAIASSDRKSGYAVFDTVNRELTVRELLK
jgi:predicted phosphodiesterase